MDVLVIGGTRFLGRQVALRLVAAGHRVTLFNRGSGSFPLADRVEWVRGDRHTDDLAQLLSARAFDATVDLVAYDGTDVGALLPAIRAGRAGHYVFISSGQVYLVREGCPRPSREEHYDGAVIPAPSDPADLAEWRYGVGKRDAEDLLADPALPVTRLRLPMVNGERDYHRRVEGYLWRVLDGEAVLLPRADLPTRHVYHDDVARAVASLLGRSDTYGRAFNLAQSESPTLRELVAHIADHVGAPCRAVDVPARAITDAGLTLKHVSPFSNPWMSFVDPSAAVRELGFAHTPPREYLGRVVASILAHPPADHPEGYARRADEVALARSLAAS
ncbi:MAG: NAD-dependent epimerase/dehydratase family protein [Polyangiales bacterium]